MEQLDVIFNIEDKDFEIDKDWYYHVFYNKRSFVDIIRNGIKSKALLKNKNCGFGDNGKYYISLSKNMNLNKHSSYILYGNFPRFIIDKNVKAIHAKRNVVYPEWCTNSILPFRESTYDDEYQAFLRIAPSRIIGIAYNLYNSYDKYGDITNDLRILKSIVLMLSKMDKDIPIIDLSSELEINKEKVLKLDI